MSSNGATAPTVDLGEVARDHPPRTVRIPVALLAHLDDYIGQGGVMLVARTLGKTLTELRNFDRDDPATFSLLPTIAWVILRKSEPMLTLDECWGFAYEVYGPPEVAPAPLDPPSSANSAPMPTRLRP